MHSPKTFFGLTVKEKTMGQKDQLSDPLKNLTVFRKSPIYPPCIAQPLPEWCHDALLKEDSRVDPTFLGQIFYSFMSSPKSKIKYRILEEPWVRYLTVCFIRFIENLHLDSLFPNRWKWHSLGLLILETFS